MKGEKNKIVLLSGSARPASTNHQLLAVMSQLLEGRYEVEVVEIKALPLFFDGRPADEVVHDFRSTVAASHLVVISTPAYLDNIPAMLKSAMEWCAASGELQGKPVVAITLTPHPPRGDHAQQSLGWTLKALNADVKVTLDLYLEDFTRPDGTVDLTAAKDHDLLQALTEEIVGWLGEEH